MVKRKKTKKNKFQEYEKNLSRLRALQDQTIQKIIYDQFRSALLTYLDLLKKKQDIYSLPEKRKRILILKIKKLLNKKRATIAKKSMLYGVEQKKKGGIGPQKKVCFRSKEKLLVKSEEKKTFLGANKLSFKSKATKAHNATPKKSSLPKQDKAVLSKAKIGFLPKEKKKGLAKPNQSSFTKLRQDALTKTGKRFFSTGKKDERSRTKQGSSFFAQKGGSSKPKQSLSSPTKKDETSKPGQGSPQFAKKDATNRLSQGFFSQGKKNTQVRDEKKVFYKPSKGPSSFAKKDWTPKPKQGFQHNPRKPQVSRFEKRFSPEKNKRHKYEEKKPVLGILYLRRGKRNTYLTLCDSKNRIKASLSAGYIKFKGVKLKSKARKAMYNLKKLAHMLVGLILRSKFNKLHLKFKTRFPRRVKKTFLRILKYKRNKFRISKLSRYRCRPHNGCRRRKKRRK